MRAFLVKKASDSEFACAIPNATGDWICTVEDIQTFILYNERGLRA